MSTTRDAELPIFPGYKTDSRRRPRRRGNRKVVMEWPRRTGRPRRAPRPALVLVFHGDGMKILSRPRNLKIVAWPDNANESPPPRRYQLRQPRAPIDASVTASTAA